MSNVLSNKSHSFDRQSKESKIETRRWDQFSIHAMLISGTKRLTSTSPTPRLDTEVLLAHLLRKQRSYLHAWPERILTPKQLAAFEMLIGKRSDGHPIAYLTGKKEFWSLEFKVTRDVLIPRPETELIVRLALDIIPENVSYLVADLGTGSGAVAISLAHERPRIEVDACDITQKALDLAKTNAQNYNVRNITYYLSDWLTDLPSENYQLIVSNPPYVAVNDAHLKQGDVRFEPDTALVAGKDGLDEIKAIAEQARPKLSLEGTLVLEHGYRQADAVKGILYSLGFSPISAHRDDQGHVRAIVAQLANRRSRRY